jgi:hypothetical protein
MKHVNGEMISAYYALILCTSCKGRIQAASRYYDWCLLYLLYMKTRSICNCERWKCGIYVQLTSVSTVLACCYPCDSNSYNSEEWRLFTINGIATPNYRKINSIIRTVHKNCDYTNLSMPSSQYKTEWIPLFVRLYGNSQFPLLRLKKLGL